MNIAKFKKELESAIYSIYPYSKLEFKNESFDSLEVTFRYFFKGEIYGASMWVSKFMLEEYPEDYAKALIIKFLNEIYDNNINIIIKEVAINDKITE